MNCLIHKLVNRVYYKILICGALQPTRVWKCDLSLLPYVFF